MKKIEFIKMHGLGNDFVLIDMRKKTVKLSKKVISKISNRHTGAGCDQILTINKPKKKINDAKISIFNSNGDIAEACGNGTRCVAKILFKELNKKNITLESQSRTLKATLKNKNNIIVNMGKIRMKWNEIPLIKKMDTNNIPIKVKNFTSGTAVNIGNPHIVFFGKKIDKINIDKVGKKIENHYYFPKKINVEFVEIINNNKIKMRVWERGVGETLACGSGACASVYAANIKGLVGKSCKVVLNKGSLLIKIQENKEMTMTGPAKISYYGEVYL